MSATGGMRRTVRTALLLAVAAVAAGLAGCEYADDVGDSPAASGASVPLVPGQGAAADPGSGSRCRRIPQSVGARGRPRAHRTVSCSADRAGSATPAAEDSRRRASSHRLASTRSPQPASGHRMRTCPSSRAPVRAARSWSAASTAAAQRKRWLTWYPGPSRPTSSGMAASPGPERAPSRGSGSASAAPGSRRRQRFLSVGRWTLAPGAPGGVKVGTCPQFRCRECPGLARHPPWDLLMRLVLGAGRLRLRIRRRFCQRNGVRIRPGVHRSRRCRGTPS